jgi:predicted lipid-binding transport protein (Tim44 family)
MLFGGGMFSGLGGISSIIGLILQIGLIIIVVRLAMKWWQRRNATASAYAGPAPGAAAGQGPLANFRTGSGFGLGSGSAPLEIGPSDYEAFERLLGEIQAAWSNEDIAKLHTLASPEMVSYFTQDLQANNARGVVNKVSDVKLEQGDLAEAWREGDTDYASVAMRFRLVDKTIDRASGRVVEGSEQPTEATEVWTFVRPRGASWELSAITPHALVPGSRHGNNARCCGLIFCYAPINEPADLKNKLGGIRCFHASRLFRARLR